MFLPALRHPHLRWVAWMTALVILLGALAPTVSRWVHASSSGMPVPLALLELCMTRDGLRSQIAIKPADGHLDGRADTGKSPGGHAQMDHCPFCLLQGDGHGLPPVDVAAALPSQGFGHEVPALFLHAPRPLHAWSAAHARAPPVLS